jgi:hypothetical protein
MQDSKKNKTIRNLEDLIEAIPFVILLAALCLGICVSYLSEPPVNHARHVEPLH